MSDEEKASILVVDDDPSTLHALLDYSYSLEITKHQQDRRHRGTPCKAIRYPRLLPWNCCLPLLHGTS